MTTYFGGERLRATSFFHVTGTTDQTAYTCPAGRYAKVKVSRYTTSGTATTNFIQILKTDGVTVSYSFDTDNLKVLDLLLEPGQILKSKPSGGGSGDSVTLAGNVLEFAKPA